LIINYLFYPLACPWSLICITSLPPLCVACISFFWGVGWGYYVEIWAVGLQTKSWTSSLCKSPVTSSLLGPNIFLSTLFSNITVLYAAIFTFPHSKWYKVFPEFNQLLISSHIQFWFVCAFPRYLNFTKFYFKGLITYISVVTFPAFDSRDMNIHLSFSALTCTPASLPASNTSVCFYFNVITQDTPKPQKRISLKVSWPSCVGTIT
jgi:hypothetical protein